MSEHIRETVVGTCVLLIAGVFLFYAMGESGFGEDQSGQYGLTASFNSVEGIAVGTDVRMAGVKVGTVTALSLNAETYRADARFTMREGIEIPDDSSVAISSEGLLGGSFVEVIPGGSPFMVEAGGEIEDTQSSVSLLTLLLKFASGGEE